MTKRQQPKKSKRGFILAGAVLLTIGLVVALELSNTTHLFGKDKATSGAIPSTPRESTPGEGGEKDKQPGEEKDTVPSSGDTAAPENPKDGDNTTAKPSGTAPLPPYGNFVSNHSPNLDGDPAPSAVQSVCNTTPGAQCSIEFTNQDGVKKTLVTQTTDNNGATYWNWDVKQAGFTAGSWKIKVVAVLNGQTTSSEAAQSLEVKP